MPNPGGYGGPRPGDFGGCTYRPMGTPPPRPEHDLPHSGGCCSTAVWLLILAVIIVIVL